MHRTLLAAAVAASLFTTTPVLEPLWRFLGRLWGEEGCSVDPFGRCVSATNQVETGCHIDPFGRCAGAASQMDTGCNVDPNGRCAG